jgi:hypothetical protein
MAQKPKAGGAKKRPPPARVSSKEQSERFVKTARELGVTEEEFEGLFRKVAPPRKAASKK